jgi:hypothetical protein
MKLVSATIPGACSVYEDLGAGVAADSFRPEERGRHEACIAANISEDGGRATREGVVFHAAKGAAALVRQTAKATRAGVTLTVKPSAMYVDKWLSSVERSAIFAKAP